jgi:hypothetical protein
VMWHRIAQVVSFFEGSSFGKGRRTVGCKISFRQGSLPVEWTRYSRLFPFVTREFSAALDL